MSNPAQALDLKRVYLDVCVLCRPFDDQQQVRIHLETSAVELILAHVRQAELMLVVSPVQYLEIEAITVLEERKQLLLLLKQEGNQIEIDLPTARQRAELWVARGLGVADAAHLAFAEEDHGGQYSPPDAGPEPFPAQDDP